MRCQLSGCVCQFWWRERRGVGSPVRRADTLGQVAISPGELSEVIFSLSVKVSCRDCPQVCSLARWPDGRESPATGAPAPACARCPPCEGFWDILTGQIEVRSALRPATPAVLSPRGPFRMRDLWRLCLLFL